MSARCGVFVMLVDASDGGSGSRWLVWAQGTLVGPEIVWIMS